MPSVYLMPSARLFLPALLSTLLLCSPTQGQNDKTSAATPQTAKSAPATQAKALSPAEELQSLVESAGGDRAALVRNLEAYLKKYPEAPERSRVYRALVESSLQLQDNARAADYAERLVALNPGDISSLILAIQLLERQEDEAAFRRAVTYSTNLLDAVNHTTVADRSPRESAEQWERYKKRDIANTFFLRGDLYLKLREFAAAQKDLQASYDLVPTAGAAQRLGEAAELQKDLNAAILEYARAFALAEGKNGDVTRAEIRKKLGNVWRIAYGSEDGLGEYLLHTYDEVTGATNPSKLRKNEGLHSFSEFTLRKAPDGTSYPLKDLKEKIVVINFWATWCGPCHALEPPFARVALQFQGLPDVQFLSANCDEDETLVGPYLQKDKLATTVVFADGLEQLFSVNSYPTVMVIDRDGKIAYRTDGFAPDSFEHDLTTAVTRLLGPTPVK
jgi:thiol-disulfide isomerase/thioredoxin